MDCASAERQVRFAAQKASRRLAKALDASSEDTRSMPAVDQIDFDMSVLDVVLGLNDQMGAECYNAGTQIDATVKGWHQWLVELTEDVIEVAQHATAGTRFQSQVSEWSRSPTLPSVIVTCMDQIWSINDSFEYHAHRRPWKDAAPYVDDSARCAPDDIDRASTWYGLVADPFGDKPRIFTTIVHADGRQVRHYGIWDSTATGPEGACNGPSDTHWTPQLTKSESASARSSPSSSASGKAKDLHLDDADVHIASENNDEEKQHPVVRWITPPSDNPPPCP
ncbi:hypothetical protein CcaverHIS002_0700010 [Cutaneotrichosporon cavernicola]|uniref:Uncharacterized protein n=1 Tax=Cutaneotrichosporon cavernicola TaxID=279322 RepID=A0AA48L9D7_9TREE|nr:uncharacterized protein CcaverHIS019_0700010 [Cutaneotrichosporon cavernicola]BEI86655.1 hypothetical protein CcaverHIS002_0700010 [Cutaneotrichosporon cavernicola]BEI94429.1 hypothetical protein CcaverHIS019_0700010 [Cutaneotrichosporon cavernicola]